MSQEKIQTGENMDVYKQAIVLKVVKPPIRSELLSFFSKRGTIWLASLELSVERRRTKANVITLANQKGQRISSKQIKT